MGLGYPKGVLSNRSIIKKNNYALISPEGRVKNVIPGFEGCEIAILGSPKLGANFVDYIINMEAGGKNIEGFGGGEIECFIYCIEGEVAISTSGTKETYTLTTGGYVYCPPKQKMYIANVSHNCCKLFLYKQKYKPYGDKKPTVIAGNANNIPFRFYEDMENVHIKDLLPTDLEFDMNIHILSFDPGGCHPIIETHYQEHGAYVLTGEGVYNLDNEWIPVQKEDYMYMSSFSLQAAYGVGREPFSYIYSKDCNRDVDL